MSHVLPRKILIAGGKPAGGVASFAEALRCGFMELGLPVEVAAPANVLGRLGELRDPGVLKILSLAAWLAAPVARRALYMAHGFPCVRNQGWLKTLALLACVRIANASRGIQVVEVSDYSALHIQEIFGIRVDAVIHNPVHPLFLEVAPQTGDGREAITYVGRLHRSKNVDKLLPAMRDVLDRNPGLRAWIIGDGELRPKLEGMATGDPRIEFLGALSPIEVRARLRRTRVFISACPTEAFGIAYVEALSQGCAVAMPASGGGLEIAPDLIGGRVQLFSPAMSREGIAAALGRALLAPFQAAPIVAYAARAVAEAYLSVDARFNNQGLYRAEAGR
jgi:glycosyltransferase involved in cell wall biosynthesis